MRQIGLEGTGAAGAAGLVVLFRSASALLGEVLAARALRLLLLLQIFARILALRADEAAAASAGLSGLASRSLLILLLPISKAGLALAQLFAR